MEQLVREEFESYAAHFGDEHNESQDDTDRPQPKTEVSDRHVYTCFTDCLY